MQAEDTDSGLHEHWTVDEAAAFFRARGGCRVVQPARLSMSRRTASQTRKQQKNVRYGNAFANFKRSALDENATSMAYALTVKPTSTARRQVTDHKRSTPTRTSPLFPRARKVDSRFPSEAIRSCQSIQPLRTGHAWHCSLDSSGRKGHFLAAIIRLLPTSSVFDSNCLYESAVMSSRLLNTIGLVVSIIGVWFLFFWGPPQPSFETGISIGLQDATPLDRSGKTVADHNREVEAKRKRYTTMSRVGLLLIIVGFVLQLCALWLPDPSRASS